MVGNLPDNCYNDIRFDSLEDAEQWYHEYATHIGFGIRRRDFRKVQDGRLVSYKWVCSKEGYRDPKWNEMEGRKRKARTETREGCGVKFRVNFDSKTSKWLIKEFATDHNHPVFNQDHVSYILSHRNIIHWNSRRRGYNRSYKPKDLPNDLKKVRREDIASADARLLVL